MTVIPGEVCGEVDAPASKSYAQRVIAAQYLASAEFTVSADAEDTEAALRVVEALRRGESVLNVGESGLSARMFAPIAALGREPVTITGRGSLMRRPMTMMTAPLRALGVEVFPLLAKEGCTKGGVVDLLPLTVRGPLRGGAVEVDGGVSSQFLTGLLMAAPLASGETIIRVRNLRSTPYIGMTLEVMRAFGVAVEQRGYEEFRVPGGQKYTAVDFPVEGDWSAAACLLVAGAMAGRVTVRGLSASSKQADVRILDALRAAGAGVKSEQLTVNSYKDKLRAFSFDATNCPDLFPALAALAAGCEGVSTIVGTERLTHKESDRAEAIAGEFGRLGIAVDISEPNVMRVKGSTSPPLRGTPPSQGGEMCHGEIKVSSHADHRIAMALAVLALGASSPVVIEGAGCVDKSYKNFWRDYGQLRTKF